MRKIASVAGIFAALSTAHVHAHSQQRHHSGKATFSQNLSSLMNAKKSTDSFTQITAYNASSDENSVVVDLSYLFDGDLNDAAGAYDL
ncbi:MAG: hypothetical protein MK214_03965 [Thalassotalea sp.]|nr:hypothetical protein [Thalassotalea sp.]